MSIEMSVTLANHAIGSRETEVSAINGRIETVVAVLFAVVAVVSVSFVAAMIALM